LQKQFDNETLSKAQIFKWHQFFGGSRNEVQKPILVVHISSRTRIRAQLASYLNPLFFTIDICYFFNSIQKLPVR